MTKPQPLYAPPRFDQRSDQQGDRNDLPGRGRVFEGTFRRPYPLPDRTRHRRRVEIHPGEPVLRAVHPHAAVVRKRHAAARRRQHHQRRSGGELGGQGRKPRRHHPGHRQLRRHHRHPPSARRRRPACRRIFADSGDQWRRRQPRASDPDAVRPLHAALEEQRPQKYEDRHLRRSQGQPHHPLVRLCARPFRRHHRSPPRARHGIAAACRSPAARGISLPHDLQGARDRPTARSTRSMSPPISRISSRSMPSRKRSITASSCRRRSTPCMSRASRRSAGRRKSGRIRKSTPSFWARPNTRRRASCTRCRGSTSSTPRSTATAARSISARPPTACRCAWR